MQPSELANILDFLRAAEGLKTATRSGWTSAGQQESVAEHTWRLCLMALVLHPGFPNVDFARLIKIWYPKIAMPRSSFSVSSRRNRRIWNPARLRRPDWFASNQ
jgi:hypothetical protein